MEPTEQHWRNGERERRERGERERERERDLNKMDYTEDAWNLFI